MESEEEEIQAPTLPEYPVQSRTLFHYFSKVSAEKENSVPKTPNNSKNRQTGSKEISRGSTSEKLSSIVTSHDQLKEENSKEVDRKADLDNKTTRKKSSPAKGKKKKRVSGKSNSIELENTPDLENKTPTKKPNVSESKKNKRASEKSKETEEYSEYVPASKRVKSTNTVSTAASKDDNFENKEDIRTSKGINSFFKQVTKEEFRKECDRESEKIKLTITALVHTPEVYIEQTSNEMPNDHKKVKATPSDEKIIPEPSRKVPVRKSISNVARPNSETDIIKIISHEEVNTEEPRERSSEQNQSILVTSKDSKTNAPKDSQRIDPKTDSVAKNKNSVIRKDTTKENYDKKETLKVCLFKKKDPPKKKYSKKAKTSVKANNVNGIAHVNYDSDSIDLDLLATYNAKTFHTAATGETGSYNYSLESSNDESNNVFSALMKKPLKSCLTKTSPKNLSHKSCITGETIKSEANSSKEETTSSSNMNKENQAENHNKDASTEVTHKPSCVPNAFTKLMFASRSTNPIENLAKEEFTETEDNDKLSIKDNSLIDFVDEINNELQPTELSSTPNALSLPNAQKFEALSSPSTLNCSEDPAKMNRRSSSRIQKRQEIAELERIELSKTLEFNLSEVHQIRRKKHKRSFQETITEQKLTKFCKSSLEDSAELPYKGEEDRSYANIKSNCRLTVKNTLKTADIFLIGKKGKKQNNIDDEDPGLAAARKAFLLSSVPQVLRNQVDISKQNDKWCDDVQYFSNIGHITQINSDYPLLNSNKKLDFPIRPEFIRQENPFESNIGESYHSTVKNSSTFNCITKKYVEQGESRDEKTPFLSFRLNTEQVYNCVKLMKLADKQKALEGQPYQSKAPNLQWQSVNIKSESAFPINKVFRRYVERKLEADTIEFEARKKNTSLNEIEEKRLSSSRRLRRRARGQNNDNIKVKRKTKQPVNGCVDSKLPNCQDCQNVPYDPYSGGSMVYTMKYAPKIMDDVIGNSNVVRKLHKWLGEWEARDLERKKKHRKSINSTSDSSEFDSDSSDNTDISSDEDDELQNTALLVGPNGIGKTATVYALAHEMGFKVLELNASSTRSGRQVLANLREATQSHSVKKREKASEEECLKNLNSKKINNKVVSNDQDKSVDKTTVILFEDIDIVFDDLDEGFHSAINNLIATTKRPIVLTTSSQNFMACNKNKVLNLKCLPQVFEFRPVQPRIISKYLQLLCLVEGFYINFDSILGLVLSKKGNISASMHQLQYDLSLYGSSGHEVPELYMKYVTDSITKIQFIGGTQIAANKDSTCKPIEKEDSLAKLLSINVTSQDCGSAIYSLLHCSLSLIGLELDTAMAHICNIARKRESISLLDNYKVLNKLLSDGFFDLFDCNRHILLPFRQVVHAKRHARSTPYPLTIKIDNSDSNITSTTAQRSDASRTEKSKRNYRRIINNDSLLMAESEDNSTADEGCQNNTESYKEKSIPKKKDISEIFDSTETSTESAIERNDIESISREANTASSEEEDRKRSGIKHVAKENAKHAIDILSQYTDYMSNYIPLQDDQAYWLANNHKLTSCSSPLCSNSNFHDSCMIRNNILTNMFGSNRNEYSNGQQTMLTQEITSSVIQMAVKLAQNSINELIPKETSFLELSVSYPTYYPTQDLVTEEATSKEKEETSLEDMCASHSNEKNDEKKIGCEDLKGKRSSFSRDLVVEASTNNDFERGFDLNHVRQLHNAEREVLGSFFPEPLTNISRAIIQDTMPAIRGMARLEEHRKASGLGTSMKRTSRSKFLHYFETQNLYSMRSQTVLNTLCNSFQE